jgi:hypothetical protein
MSYVLHVWEHPVPTSVAEAGRIHARLSGERCAQNPKFVELARRLTERHPCITTLDDDDPQAVWSDGPLDGRTDTPVYGLGVQSGHLGAVLPFAVAKAGELGLTVYDTQAGEVHLPGGKVLTLPGRSPVDFGPAEEVDPEDLDTKGHVGRVLQQCLKPTMDRFGFKAVKSNAGFERRHRECRQTLFFNVAEGHPSFDLEVFFRINPKLSGRFQPIADRWASSGWAIDIKAAADIAGAEPFGDQPDRNGRSSIYNVSRLRVWADNLADFFSRAIVPIADKCGTARDMEPLLNPAPATVSPFKQYPYSLILAYEVQDPGLDAKVAEWRRKTPPGFRTENLEKLLSELRAS